MNTGTQQPISVKHRRNDLLLLSGVLLLVVIIALVYAFTRKAGSYAVVLKNGNEIGRYALSENCEIPISDGDVITNLLVIRDGKAQISEAICPDQICVEHRPISKSGETIVCLPYEVVIKIIASEKGDTPDIVG